jgi:hypothetical protein
MTQLAFVFYCAIGFFLWLELMRDPLHEIEWIDILIGLPAVTLLWPLFIIRQLID